MPPEDYAKLSRRERQIMDVLYERGQCSAQDIQDAISDAPSYSAVRALIARLVEKEAVEFRLDGKKHIYSPATTKVKAQESALNRLIKTFFKGSRVNAVTALIDLEGENMSVREIAELERSIARIKKAQARNTDKSK